VEQSGIFGRYAVREVELEAAEGRRISEDEGRRDGPIHFNVCLEEGLEPLDAGGHGATPKQPEASPREGVDAVSEAHRCDWREFWEARGDLIVLASGIHPDDVPLTRDFLHKLGAPVVAEATSNLCGDGPAGPLRISGGEQALKRIHAQRVLRLGAVPSWRWWRDLDHRDDVRVLSVSRAPFRGLARTRHVSVVPWETLQVPGAGLQVSDCPTVKSRSAMLSGLLEAHPLSEPAWMRHVSRCIGAGASVFLGNSLPIREWNLAADTPKEGTQFFANRGANGIDGLVSTWLGLGAETGESWLIVGDLSALYDLGAPWILPQLHKAKRRIVVVNNGGGQIFSRVSWLGQAGEDTKRLLANPHALSFEPWARMWGVRPDAAQTEAFWSAWQK
jgi:2-succinyl-5-enolpyruvyl-6-hydroxy-3-cyclohexene-1-carboxylate synthase